MENKNDAPKIIIQLILGALVYYLFSFKYKDDLIVSLSLQVYYQVLVIIVITNSYIAKYLDQARVFISHHIMLQCSKNYKNNHYNEQRTTVIEKSKTAKLSEKAQEMVNGLSETDIALEYEISKVYEEVQKIKDKR